MARILIDVSRAVIENAGIARFTQKISESVVEKDQANSYTFMATFWKNDRAKIAKIKGLEKYCRMLIKHIPGAVKEYLWRTGGGFFLNWWYSSYDIFFAPSFMELPKFIRIPSIVVIYDLSTARFPTQRGEAVSRRLTAQMKIACEKADKIIAISAQTKNDLLNFFKTDPSKIEVIYPGFDTKFRDLSQKRENYILAVGTLEPRKNLPNLIRAYCQLPTDIATKYRLKIVGGVGWNDKEIYSALTNAKYKNNIELLGFVPDDELVKLYNRTSLFVYPSLFEGFGFPVVEAMACGAPVITTNISSLPEAGGNAAVYIEDPHNVKELSEAMVTTLRSTSYREDLSKKSLANAKRFSWAKAAEQTIQVVEQLRQSINNEKSA